MAPTTPKKNKSVEMTDEDRQPGVIYIGHVPHGFYEKELKKYFSQFGKVLQIKVSRSKKNGKSKGYAFVKFQYAAVAKTVAETCHNYLFFNKLLKCEYRKAEDVHPNTFFSYDWRPNSKPKRLHNTAKSDVKVKQLAERSSKRQAAKLKKLKELGLDLTLDQIVTSLPVKASVPSQVEGSSPVDETSSQVRTSSTDAASAISPQDGAATRKLKRKRPSSELKSDSVVAKASPVTEKTKSRQAKRPIVSGGKEKKKIRK